MINILTEMDFILSPKQFMLSALFILLSGLLFSGGMYYFLNPEKFVKTISEYAPVTREPSSFSLDVNTPEDNTLTYERNILISGKSAPKATVIITRLESTVGFEADGKGAFSKVIQLEKGPNPITVTAFDSSGNIKTLNRNIYFTEEKLDEE